MKIPEEIRGELLRVGLTGTEWKRIREAFDKIPEPPSIHAEVQHLLDTSKRLREAFIAAASLPAENPEGAEVIPEKWADLEPWFIRRALGAHPGHAISELALLIGIPRNTLYRKLRLYNITPDRSPRAEALAEIEDGIRDLTSMLESEAA
jgi:DNA-binding NtrC family response regulator